MSPQSADPALAACVPRPCRPCPGVARPWHPARDFTLVELLVTITIIAMLAGVSLGALQVARQTARKAKTKALIVKLDHVIMQKYESYQTRRVPVSTRDIPRNASDYTEQVARRRLNALRDLMRMELPERWNDITRAPITGIERPALVQMYLAKYDQNEPTGEFGPAECLYMIVALGSPGDMEHFHQSEIGDADGDGWPEFHDAWGRPIMFLRWAPGFNNESEIQTGDPLEDHDPFDTRQLESGAYRLIPLIYSGGRDKKYDLQITRDYHYEGNPYQNGDGTPLDDPDNPDGGLDHHDNIHNHFIEQK